MVMNSDRHIYIIITNNMSINNIVLNFIYSRIVCLMVGVLGTDHPTAGDTGKYFFFSKEDMDSMLGEDNWSGKKYVVIQEGSQHWTGEVVIWKNNNGIHGRRNTGAANGQWASGDTISLSSCKSGNCIWL